MSGQEALKRESGMGKDIGFPSPDEAFVPGAGGIAPGISILDLIVLFPEEPQADVHDFRIVERSPIS